MASLIGFLKRLLHEHDWEGIGRIIVLHEPTFSIYHARRTTWRRCKDCGLRLLNRLGESRMSELVISNFKIRRCKCGKHIIPGSKLCPKCAAVERWNKRRKEVK